MSLLFNNSFILFLTFFISIAFVLKSWLFKSSKKLPPSPPRLPIIGNLHQMGSFPQRSLRALSEKYGPVMLLHMGSKRVLVFTSADAQREVMKTHDLAFADRPKSNAAGRILYQYKDMAFSPYGETWRQGRSVCVLHLLSNKSCQSFRGIKEEEIRIMLEKIRKSSASSSVINAEETFSTLTNDIIGRAAFGKKFAANDESAGKLRKLLSDVPHISSAFNVADYIPWLSWVNYLNGFEAKLTQIAKDADEYMEDVIEETKRKQENGELCQQNFASIILELQKNDATGFTMERDSVKGLILDMYIGATDTIYLLLHWMMMELLKNRNVMTKLQKEVRDIVGSKFDITDEDLEKMHYLHAVIKETLRLHPPATIISRAARQDVKLMGYHVEKGTWVLINVWAIGRDPTLWEEPEEFKPERFLNSSLDFNGENFEYIPFGAGRRSCPGDKFALGVAKLTMANLMHKFDTSLPDGLKPEDIDPVDYVGITVQEKKPLLFVATPVTSY